MTLRMKLHNEYKSLLIKDAHPSSNRPHWPARSDTVSFCALRRGVSAKHFSAKPQDRSKPFLHDSVYEHDFRNFVDVGQNPVLSVPCKNLLLPLTIDYHP